jgi:hypothetical protein
MQHFNVPYGTLTRVVQIVAPRLPQRVHTKYRRAVTPWTRMANAIYRLQSFAIHRKANAIYRVALLCEAVYGTCHARL